MNKDYHFCFPKKVSLQMSSGVGIGRVSPPQGGVSPPQPTRGSEERRKFTLYHTAGSGAKPRPPTHFWHIRGPQNTTGRENRRPYVPTKPAFPVKIHSIDNWRRCPWPPSGYALALSSTRQHMSSGDYCLEEKKIIITVLCCCVYTIVPNEKRGYFVTWLLRFVCVYVLCASIFFLMMADLFVFG